MKYIFAIPVGAWVFYWYNYVLYHTQLGYWPWFFLAAAYMLLLIKNPFVSLLIKIVAPFAIVCQILGWFSIIKLPLF